jgi:putative colanic acid biosynthesis acetyltransferase WcaF
LQYLCVCGHSFSAQANNGNSFNTRSTIIGDKVTVSQRTYLCSATHETNSLNLPFVAGEIIIKDFVWIAAEAFIKTNTVIGTGAIVGARSVVVKDVEPWSVVGGNPAKFIKKRILAE